MSPTPSASTAKTHDFAQPQEAAPAFCPGPPDQRPDDGPSKSDAGNSEDCGKVGLDDEVACAHRGKSTTTRGLALMAPPPVRAMFTSTSRSIWYACSTRSYSASLLRRLDGLQEGWHVLSI